MVPCGHLSERLCLSLPRWGISSTNLFVPLKETGTWTESDNVMKEIVKAKSGYETYVTSQIGVHKTLTTCVYSLVVGQVRS